MFGSKACGRKPRRCWNICTCKAQHVSKLLSQGTTAVPGPVYTKNFTRQYQDWKSRMNWTSHALVDVGIASLCAMAERTRPGDLTEGDLDRITEELSAVYFGGAMISYLTCVFMNSAYVQPGMKDAGRQDYKERILKAYRQPSPAELAGTRCVFCGEPAVALVHRGQIPLLTGEDTLNFYPAGRGGLPVSGDCLTAIQALPMGCKRVEGKLFAVHADNPELTIAMARRYVEDNRRLVALSRAGKITKESGPTEGLTREVSMGDKYPDSKSPASLITADLMDVLGQLRLVRTGSADFGSVSCYWLSSSGQGPFLDLFYL